MRIEATCPGTFPARPRAQRALRWLLFSAALALFLAPYPTGAQNNKLLATGSGHVHLDGAYRNFAFSAIKDRDGEVNGQAQLNNRLVPVTNHVEVRCLSVQGNTATITGVIKKSKSKVSPDFEFIEGQPVIFRVQDNGEGQGEPPDRISLLEPTGCCPTDEPLPCDQEPPFPLPLFPIENGNIQVHER